MLRFFVAIVATGIILCQNLVAEGWLNEKITTVFSRITVIILAGLSVQYVINGLTAIGIVSFCGWPQAGKPR